ncbi:DUF2591 domain-containing protein [Salmonella enterica]|nr:DUF2591 domain-containing protein [Salmonella enterica]
MGRWWRYKWITFHPSLTISFLDQLTEWCVDAKGVSPIFDIRPLRAAMIVFLLMQDANNA